MWKKGKKSYPSLMDTGSFVRWSLSDCLSCEFGICWGIEQKGVWKKENLALFLFYRLHIQVKETYNKLLNGIKASGILSVVVGSFMLVLSRRS